MANDWIKVTSKTEQETMARIASIIRNTIIKSTVMCHTVVAFYVFLRYISMKYNENKLLFRAYFPYDTTVSPNYELTILGQFVAALYAATSYTAVDTFVAMLILHVCGQLSGIKNELSRLPTYDKKDLKRRLKEIVQKHEYVNRFVIGKSFEKISFLFFQISKLYYIKEKKNKVIAESFIYIYI